MKPCPLANDNGIVLVHAPSEPILVRRIPDGTTSVLIRGHASGKADLVILGPLSRARYKVAAGVAYTVRFVLVPEAAHGILGESVAAFTDRIRLGDELWGSRGQQLRDRITGQAPDHAVRELAAFVASSIAAHRTSAADGLVATARRALDAAAPSIGDVARTLGVSERYLRRIFVERIGLSPKRYARIARLQRVLARMRHPSSERISWSRLASEHGYFGGDGHRDP